MAKKLIEILKQIKNEEENFDLYLNQSLPHEVIDFINKIKSITPVYLFSGIIRDYFTKNSYEIRDIDLIYEDNIDLEIIFEDLDFKLNSFGGYKTQLKNIPIDIWRIDNTWGLKNGQLKIPYSKIYDLTNTTFFNFSSIIYSFNDKKFIIGKPFLQFIRDKKINIVSHHNPYPELCIVNSFYYAEKLNLDFSENLRRYLIKNFYKTSFEKLNDIQLKHFKKNLFTENDLIQKMRSLESKNYGIIDL